MNVMMELDAGEIRRFLPYQLITECREGSRWDTGRRRRAYAEAFDEAERARLPAIFRTARNWALVSGPPEKIRMSCATYNLWRKLGRFCASL